MSIVKKGHRFKKRHIKRHKEKFVYVQLYQANMLKQKITLLLLLFVCLLLCYLFLFLAVFLLNDAAAVLVDILSFVSVGHVVENARLVDVDGAATVERP